MSANEACRNCRFSKTEGPALLCRRYPPTATDGTFPHMAPGDWCGEWLAMRRGAGLPAGIAPRPAPSPGTEAATLRQIGVKP